AAASRRRSSHVHSRRSDRRPWSQRHCAAGRGWIPLVPQPSRARWPPLGASEPRGPGERLQRSAQPTLGAITTASLPSSLAPLLLLWLRSPLFYHFFTTKVLGTSQGYAILSLLARIPLSGYDLAREMKKPHSFFFG